MKPIWMSLMVFLLALPNISFKSSVDHHTSNSEGDDPNSNLSTIEVRQRLNDLEGMIDLKFNSDVEKNIRYYLSRRKRTFGKLIGRSKKYFPMFEHYLQVNNLPDELKYLSIVESALDPAAKSIVGASGLWQFMKGTGLKYGLKIDSYVDERNDPIKSTEAAFVYLEELHNRYNDWTLALAAYNCGPGRVNRAIKQARTMDFWKLKKYLPSETRNYVPAFIATTYVMNYYQSHNIKPIAADYKFQNLKTTTVFESSSFYEISKLSGIGSQEIEKLNPAYKKRFIPRSKSGNYLTLPKEGMMLYKDKKRQAKLTRFYNSNNSDYNNYMSIPSDMMKSTYIVQKGETLEYIAKLLRCSITDLRDWNKLVDFSVFNGQELTVYFPKENLQRSNVVNNNDDSENDEKDLPKRILYHYIQKGETLTEISNYYPDVTLSQIIRANKLFGEIKLQPGAKLKIKEL